MLELNKHLKNFETFITIVTIFIMAMYLTMYRKHNITEAVCYLLIPEKGLSVVGPKKAFSF